MATERIFQIGDVVTVEFDPRESDGEYDESYYYTEITKVDDKGIHILPDVDCRTLIVNTSFVLKIKGEHRKHTIYVSPKPDIGWREIRREIIDYAMIHDKTGEMSSHPAGEIHKYRIVGQHNNRENLDNIDVDGYYQGLIINALSDLGIIIAYMDWLDTIPNVTHSEFMWSQINIDERFHYHDNEPGVDISRPLDIEDYINNVVLNWRINEHFENADNIQEVIFPQPIVKYSHKK